MNAPRILVVDDSLTIRRALEFILKPHGYALEFAADGRDALNRASTFAPDLVLLDYVLPDMRGPDVCAALAVMPASAHTPVILVSAKGASIRQAYQDAQNVVSYITKPFKAEVVASVVANALARLRQASPAAGPTQSTVSPPAAPSPETNGAPAPAVPPRHGSAPASLEETFSALLGQLEDAIAADAERSRGASPLAPSNDDSVLARLAPGLARASRRMGELGQHLVDGTLAPYRLRPDGSFASIAATLLEAHQTLCEAAIALAAAGTPSARRPAPVRIVAAVPSDHPLCDDLLQALALAPEVRALVVHSEFEQVPALVRLLAPACAILARGPHPALEEAWQRSIGVRPPETRAFSLGPRPAEEASAESGDDWLVDAAAVRRLIGELAAAAGATATTSVDIGLEIVTV